MPKSATSAWPSGEQDVVGLDVAVHDAVAVRVVQRLGHLAGEPDGVLDRQLDFALQPVAQGLALDVGHRVPEPACCLARVEHGQDVRVLEPGRGLDLAQEALRAERRASSGWSTLSATGRSCLMSRARYTVAMPPRPSSRSSRSGRPEQL